MNMKHFYLIFCLAFSVFATGQIINFPDPNFKAKLLQLSFYHFPTGEDIPLDANNDGEIDMTEALAVDFLDVSSSNISNLTGISNFTNMWSLICSDNLLTTLTIDDSVHLEYLSASHNQLTSFSFTPHPNYFDSVDLSHNNFTSLVIENMHPYDGFNLSHNPLTSLTIINSSFGNFSLEYTNLSSVQFVGYVSFVDASFRNNQFTLLDLSGASFDDQFTLSLGNNVEDRVIFPAYDHPKIYYSSTNTFLDLGNFHGETDCFSSGPESGKITIADSPNLVGVNLKNGFDHLPSMCYDFDEIEDPYLRNPITLEISNCPNLTYICTDELEQNTFQSLINALGLQNQIQLNTYCTFTPGGIFYTVSGYTKFDSDANGCDASDALVPNQKFTITNGTQTSTIIADDLGNYTIDVGAGTHTITPIIDASGFNVSPSSITANFPTQTSPMSQNFCISAGTPIHDFEITLVPVDMSRPGFDANYKIIFKNTGNRIDNGNIVLAYQDDALDFVSSSQIPNSNSDGNLNWAFTNLAPFETRTIDVTFNLNSPMETPPLNNGDILNFTSSIAEDGASQPFPNNHLLNQTVVNSFDPNDKICLEGQNLSTDFVGNYISYRIRFENTGTFAAENIVVKDMIDATRFDITTLTPVTASHNFYTRIIDNKVEFVFENINLPFDDAHNDGYVIFKIKLLSTLTENIWVDNQASIYFDYNFPVVTNNATSIISNLATPTLDFTNQFVISPVPAKNTLNIHSNDNLEIRNVEIYNTLGQLVQTEIGNQQTIDVSRLTKGSYYLKIYTNELNSVEQFLKE